LRPLRNRVAPDGSLHALSARGLFTGNRGVIHDPETRIATGRRWTTRAWIVCACRWKDVRRDVWGRNGREGRAGWSELFFLDEVTALAAGHRPCFCCRRERATQFAKAFALGNGLPTVSAPRIDAILHRQRLLSGTGEPPALTMTELAALPDGAIAAVGDAFHALRAGMLLPWSFEGYGTPADATARVVRLVTPPATVAALRAGYRPRWHDSATDPLAREASGRR